MTLDLDAIKARTEAATSGPWGVDGQAHPGPSDSLAVYSAKDAGVIAYAQPSWDDAEFIAAARQDIPDLVAEVERLQGIVDRVRQLAHIWEGALSNPFRVVLLAEVTQDLLDALDAT